MSLSEFADFRSVSFPFAVSFRSVRFSPKITERLRNASRCRRRRRLGSISISAPAAGGDRKCRALHQPCRRISIAPSSSISRERPTTPPPCPTISRKTPNLRERHPRMCTCMRWVILGCAAQRSESAQCRCPARVVGVVERRRRRRASISFHFPCSSISLFFSILLEIQQPSRSERLGRSRTQPLHLRACTSTCMAMGRQATPRSGNSVFICSSTDKTPFGTRRH